MIARLRERYNQEIRPELRREFDYSNDFEVPKLEKVVMNIGLGEAITNNRALDAAVEDMAAISGQKPVVTRSKKSIAAFRLREGMPIGVKVTLRGDRMYEFVDRLVNASLPRIRDFRGVSPNSFDGRGNYTLGLTEQIIFPEVDYDRIDRIRGMEVSIVTTATSDDEGRALLAKLGMPFQHAGQGAENQVGAR